MDLNIQLHNRIKKSFPIDPYPTQLDFALQIYRSLNEKRKVTILESPTGTGKSQALIAGCIEWLVDLRTDSLIKEKQVVKRDGNLPDWFFEDNTTQEQVKTACIIANKKVNQNQNQKKSVPLDNKVEKPIESNDDYLFDYSSDDQEHKYKNKMILGLQKKDIQIIYTSRTHSQLKQWTSAIKSNQISLVTLASRQQLCLNTQIIQQSQGSINKLNHLCKNAKQKNQCQFHKGYMQWKTDDQTNELKTQQILDIEDIRKVGSKCNLCPYYASQQLIEYADVICIPYQLLLENLDKFTNPIVIVDEAHNFSNAMLQAKSAQITYRNLISVINGLEAYRKRYHQRVKAKTLYYLNQSHKLATKFSKTLLTLNEKTETYTVIPILQYMVQLEMQNFELSKFLKQFFKTLMFMIQILRLERNEIKGRGLH